MGRVKSGGFLEPEDCVIPTTRPQRPSATRANRGHHNAVEDFSTSTASRGVAWAGSPVLAFKVVRHGMMGG
jgi:hypothetical protein